MLFNPSQYSKLPVIDFDEVKKEICKKHNLNEYSSCDALLIIARQKRLEFMEIKTFEKLLSLLDKKYGDFERKKNKIIKKILEVDAECSVKRRYLLVESYHQK